MIGKTNAISSGLPNGVSVNGTEITIDTDQYTAVIAGQDGDDQTGKVVISGLEIPVELDTNTDSSVQVTNLTPANVKKNITILGVTGTLESGTYWDGTYIEQNVFNVTLNITNYTVKGGSTFYYSTDGGITYNQIMGTGTINLLDVYQLDFKIIKPDSSSNKFETIFDVGTTEGGSEICRAVIPSALTTYFEKNIGGTITVSADSYYYVSIQQS